MGGANSIRLPGFHSNSDANTHTDPIVRSSESSLNGKLVVEDANTNARKVISAPSKIGEDRGHATTVANSVLASSDSESEHGDQFHEKAKRYIGARNLGLEERSVDRNKAEAQATYEQVMLVPETPEYEIRRAPTSLFSESMSGIATIPISSDSAYVSQSIEPNTMIADNEQSVYHTANMRLGLQSSLQQPCGDLRANTKGDDVVTKQRPSRSSKVMSIPCTPSEAQYDRRTSRRTETRSSSSSETESTSPRRSARLATRSGSRSGRRSNVRKKLRWAESERFAKESESEYERGRPRRSRKRSSMRRSPRDDLTSDSSSSDREHVRTAKPKHMLRPPKYDGTTSFETFLAQFKNCSQYNTWDKDEQLAYLRGTLDKEAAQVLWDSSAEKVASVHKLIKTLRARFGGVNRADKYRIEVKKKRRKAGESLRTLHSDIRRLTALAFPDIDYAARERIACDYFVDALDEPKFALRVRERTPHDLDSALQVAEQLEVWTNNTDHLEHSKEYVRDRRTREVAQSTATKLAKADQTEDLLKRIKELEMRVSKDEASAKARSSVNTKETGANKSDEQSVDTNIRKPRNVCWGCSDPGHRLWQCPKLSEADKKKCDKRIQKVRLIADHNAATCVTVRYKGRPLKALIDKGSDITIAGSRIAKKYRWKVHTSELKSVKTANNEPMVITGVAHEALLVGKKVIWSDIYVTPDIDDMILGIDWLKKQGRMTWDFETRRVRFGDDEWIELQQGSDHHCRRIYVESDTTLAPRQETAVPVRVTRRSTRDRPYEAVSECF